VDRRAKETGVRVGKVNDARLVSGRPDAEIVKLGEELEAGLVVVGNRARAR
jgi:nucleotide-binding universal stress UspA family protein